MPRRLRESPAAFVSRLRLIIARGRAALAIRRDFAGNRADGPTEHCNSVSDAP
jgi:hypothetical protein